MGLGITKLLRKTQIFFNLYEFQIRKGLFGFDNACIFLRGVDKNSIIPILRRNGASIGENCDIESMLVFHNSSDFSNLIIGNFCHIGKDCFFDLRDKVILEDKVTVSMKTTFITHIDTGCSDLKEDYPDSHALIHIYQNSFIGACSTILHGVTIKENCIVAAGTLVIKTVEFNTVVGGIPARLLKDLNESY